MRSIGLTVRVSDALYERLKDPSDADAVVEAVAETSAAMQHHITGMRRFWAQDKPCSGGGYAHGPHGKCPGYSTDHT